MTVMESWRSPHHFLLSYHDGNRNTKKKLTNKEKLTVKQHFWTCTILSLEIALWDYFWCSLVSFFEDGRNPQELNPRKIHLHFWHLKLLLNNKSFDVISLGASLMPLQSGVYCIWSYMHSVTSNTLVLPFLDLGEISRLSEPTDMNTSIHALLQTLENHWDCISDQKTITDNQTKYVASLSRRRSRSRYKHMQRKTETLRVVYLRSLT